MSPFEVSNWADIARTGEPVTAGIPLPQGAVYDLSKLRITDNSGNTVPAQFKALSKWWREKNLGAQNPSVKWVLCDFQAGVPAANRTSFTLKDDNASGAPSTALSLTQDASQVTVVTGPLKFTVSKTHFNLFDGVWLDANANGQFEAGEQIVASNAQNGGVITSGDWSTQGCVNGTPHYSSQKAPERVVIEEQGPLKVLIRVEGRHYAASAGTTKGLYGYQVFITAYAGKPCVDVQWAVTNTYMEGDKPELGATPWTAYVWPFTAYNLDLNLNLGGTQTYALLGQTEATGTLAASAVRLLQSQGNYSITNATGGTDARGAASVSNGTLGVRVAMRDFAPNNPKGISLIKDKISLEIFPSSATPYSLDPFSRKNHRMRFEFFGGAPASGALLSLSKQMDAPLRLLAPREWYRLTNAWERGFGVPPSNEWDRKAPSAWTRMAKTSSGVNWINYGELDEFNGGGDHWNLTSCYWHYLLTGNPEEFEYAEKQTLNFNDIVPVHTGSNRWTDLAYWALPEGHLSGLSNFHNPEELGFQASIQFYNGTYTWHRSNIPDAGHMPNKEELEYYLLTGDPATRDAIESEGIRAVCHIFYRTYGAYSGWPYDIGQGRKVNLDSFYVMPYGPRYIARPGLVACHAYEVTGDDRYLYPARIASYSLRNYIKRNPIGYMAEANDALYADNAKNEPAPKPAGQKESMLIPGFEPGLHYYFSLVSFDKAGNASALSNVANLTTGISRGNGNVSSRFGLLGARAMPFNRSVRISYSVASDPKPFTIAIYDVRSRLVRRLFSGTERPGLHEKIWDCRIAGSGIYMVRFVAPGTSRLVKVALYK